MAEGQIETWYKQDAPRVLVDAVRLTEDNAKMVAAWSGGELVEEINPEHPEENQPGINVRTAAGTKRASLHMYIVRYGNSYFVSSNRQFETVYAPIYSVAPPLESAGDTRKRLGFADPFAPPGANV